MGTREIKTLIKNRHEREKVPFPHITESIEKAILTLQEAKNFLIESETNPERLFKESKERLGNTKHILFDSVRKSGDEIQPHDVLSNIAEISQKYFNEWLKGKGIKEKAEIKVRNPLTFPSIFAVYYEDIEIIQFNLFEQWYGIREKPQLESIIEEKIQKEKERQIKLMEVSEEKLQYFEKALKNPWKKAKFPVDIPLLLFKKKQIVEAIKKKIQNEKKIIEEGKETIQKWDESLPLEIKRNRQLEDGIKKLEPFFQELEYRLETHSYGLY